MLEHVEKLNDTDENHAGAGCIDLLVSTATTELL